MKFYFIISLMLSTFIAFVLASCSSGGSSSSGSDSLTVTLKSSALSTATSLSQMTLPAISAGQGTAVTVDSSSCVTDSGYSYCACTVQNEAHTEVTINQSGYCISPLKVGGGISSISLFRVGRLPARFLGGGQELSTNRTQQLDVQSFELKDASQLTGEDNIQDSNASSDWEGVQVYLSHLDIKLPPVTIASQSTYLTIRYLFYAQPLTDESVIQSCGLDSAALSGIATNALYLSGLTFKRNDILICSRTDSTACANSEFKFLDTSGSGSLVTTRPTTEGNIFKFSIVADSELNCSTSNGVPDMNIGGFNLLANLSSGFNVTAEINGGKKTYTVSSGGSSSSTSGSTLAVTLDFDISNMIFVKTSGTNLTTWLSSSNLSTILQNIHFLPVYMRNQLDTVFDGSSYTSRDLGLPVSATLVVQ